MFDISSRELYRLIRRTYARLQVPKVIWGLKDRSQPARRDKAQSKREQLTKLELNHKINQFWFHVTHVNNEFGLGLGEAFQTQRDLGIKLAKKTYTIHEYRY